MACCQGKRKEKKKRFENFIKSLLQKKALDQAIDQLLT